MVLELLFGVASKTSVLARVLESDVPQQDGHVTAYIFAHKFHTLSIYGDVWHHVLGCYHRIAHL